MEGGAILSILYLFGSIAYLLMAAGFMDFDAGAAGKSHKKEKR